MSGFLGVRLFLWIYLLISMGLFGGVWLYIKRELIKKVYYKIRFPEKILRILIHYPSGLYKEYWRLVPHDKTFEADKGRYNYDAETVIKEKDWIIKKENKKEDFVIEIENKKYNLKNKLKIKEKGTSYPEVHYFFNRPDPIKFDDSNNSELKFSSANQKDFEENDLFGKLLTAGLTNNLLNIIMILVVVNTLATVFIILKLMEVI